MKTELIREKDGVRVSRVYMENGTAILKSFARGISTREIANYRILSALGIPALKVYEVTEDSILMEDMESPGCRYRLGTQADMADENIARDLGKWYRKLHDEGYGYVKLHGAGMYSETDMFTLENIAAIAERAGDIPGLRRLMDDFERISQLIRALPETITYNDFYYTNMAVARDGSGAIMFDHNLMGRGHAYMDIRNVSWSLRAKEAFMDGYGPRDFDMEKAVDDVVSPIVTLHMAYGCETFPNWGRQTLNEMKNGYEAAISALL